MKTLYLFRHAKSSWDDPALEDFDRPLNKRGKKTAPLMGKVMKERKVEPEIVLCSPARRTRETAKLALQKSHIEAPIIYEEAIYEASVRTLIAVLSSLKEPVESVLMIGHNPGMSDLLHTIARASEDFPTACLAKVSLEITTWKELAPQSGRLEWILRPRELFADEMQGR